MRLICERLAMSLEAQTLSAAIVLKVLCHTSKAGSIIGKGGSGLRELRSLGVAVDMPRDDVGVGERLLSITGPVPAACAAVSTVLSKLTSQQQEMRLHHEGAPQTWAGGMPATAMQELAMQQL